MAKWKGTGLKDSLFPWIHVCYLAKSILYTFYKNKHNFKYISGGRDSRILSKTAESVLLKTWSFYLAMPRLKATLQLFFGGSGGSRSAASRDVTQAHLCHSKTTSISQQSSGKGARAQSSPDPIWENALETASGTSKQCSETSQTGLLSRRHIKIIVPFWKIDI